MTDAVKPLGFKLEQRGGTWILVYDSGGCHPATDEEIALWNHRTPPAGWKLVKDEPVAWRYLTPHGYVVTKTMTYSSSQPLYAAPENDDEFQ